MQQTFGKVKTNSYATFSNGSLYMGMPVFADQQEHTDNSSAQTQNVVWKTNWERWMKGTNGER